MCVSLVVCGDVFFMEKSNEEENVKCAFERTHHATTMKVNCLNRLKSCQSIASLEEEEKRARHKVHPRFDSSREAKYFNEMSTRFIISSIFM